jgi:carbamoyltransferase
MIVLGISGREQDAAAALVVNGGVAAAVSEESFIRIPRIGYRHTGGTPASAIAVCLVRAGIEIGAVDHVAVAGPGSSRPRLPGLVGKPVVRVGALEASAAFAAPPGVPGQVLAISDEAGADSAVFRTGTGRVQRLRSIDGIGSVAECIRIVRTGLGVGNGWAPLEAIGAASEARYLDLFRTALRFQPESGFQCDTAAVRAIIARAGEGLTEPLTAPSPLHVEVRRRRGALAATVLTRVGELVAEAGEHVLTSNGGAEPLGVTGTLLTSETVCAAIDASLRGRVRVVPLPGASVLALGAALALDGTPVPPLRSLALGPVYDEQQVKDALERCRLDYVYEPDWHRLTRRIARLLGRGKLVGWFQGAMDFGDRSLGGRSVLVDPSSRYARDNVNRYLRHGSDDLPPPLSIRVEDAAEVFEQRICSPLGFTLARVRDDARTRVQAAVDASGACRVHTVTADSAPALWRLLQAHREVNGVPGLLNVNLAAPDEPTACTPLDALRSTFSCAADALVMERFLVMKDYWLLRSDVD